MTSEVFMGASLPQAPGNAQSDFLSLSNREWIKVRIPRKHSRFEPLNRKAGDVAQASSPASSPGVPPGGRAGSETLPQLAAGTDCATRFAGSLHLQQSDAHWDHEPETPRSREIKSGIFRIVERCKPKLINSEICFFEFLSFGFTWWFMGRG